MDAQDAFGLCFWPSTCPQKANKNVYKLTKDGTQLMHGRAPGAIMLVWLPNRPNFSLLAHTDNSKEVAVYVGPTNE